MNFSVESRLRFLLFDHTNFHFEMLPDDQSSLIEGPARGKERRKRITDNPNPGTAEEKVDVLQSNQYRYERIEKQTINYEPWTEEEDEKLKAAVQSIEGKDRWKKIAECLGNRTSLQCQCRWHRDLCPWSKEEDEKIIKWVNTNGKNWWAISLSLFLPYRSRKQCEERWFAIKDMNLASASCPEAQQNRVGVGATQQMFEWSPDIANMSQSFTSQVKVGIMEINKASDISCDGQQRSPPYLKRKRKMTYSTKQWTKEEDEKLFAAEAEHSIEGRDKWHEIAECLGDRTPDQCHASWNFVRQWSLGLPWSQEEDEKLLKWVNTNGKKWWDKGLCPFLPHRSTRQCVHRWLAIKEKMDMNLASGGLVPQFECLSVVSEEAQQNSVDFGAIQLPDVPHSFTSQVKMGGMEINKASHIAYDGLRRPSCLKRGRRAGSLKKPYNHEPWSEEEDEKLKVAVQSIEGRGCWEKIAECVGNRTALQCQLRWCVDHLYFLKGPWCKEEDAKLIKLVKKKGKNWVAISQSPFLRDRSSQQCEDRWLAIKDMNLASA